MAETKAVLFSTSNPNKLAKEQELKSVYEYYCQFPSENRFAEIEKAKGGVDPLKRVIYNSTIYIILTNKDTLLEIITKCNEANYSGVVFDAISQCIGYYRDLGPQSRISMLASIDKIYSTSFPYVNRITSSLLSLSQCYSISNSVMWLSQQVLETVSQNIGTIISCSKKQKDSSVIPSVLLWCLRKCHDHYLIAPPLVEKEIIIVQKIFALDHDSVLRCGIDAILYLCILRNAIPAFKELFSNLLQDSSLQLILQTVPPLSFFSFSSENEIQQNINAFYNALQDGKNRGDSQSIQTALRSLLQFRSSNIIWYTAVFSVLRLSLLLHPNDTLNDVLTDYCFQYTRMINPMNTPFKNLPKKDVIESLQWLLLFNIQTTSKDSIHRYITQTSNLASEHGNNVLEFIRFGMRFATSGQKNSLVIAVQQFFKNSFNSSNWWKQVSSQFPADIQNCINQLKSMEIVEPSTAVPESKRQRIDTNETPVEVQKMILLLNSFKQSEMTLYIKSLKGNDQYSAFINSIPSFLDSFSELSESTMFIHSFLEIFDTDESFACSILSDCRKNCCILDYYVIVHIIKTGLQLYLNTLHQKLPEFHHQEVHNGFNHHFYQYLLMNSEMKTKLGDHLQSCFSKQLGDIVDSILSTSVILDMMKKEEEESPLMVVLTVVIPTLLSVCRKALHILPLINFLFGYSSLLSLYVPLLENSVVVLMNYDEIKSFSFLKQYSLQELKWFWELYSHGQFIYEKINKTVRVVFQITQELSVSKRNVNLKAISDLCKECQPDQQLVECLLSQGMEFATFNQMIFEAWEYAHEEDLFRYFHQAIKSLRLYEQDDQKRILESIICYISAVIARKKIDSSLESNCREVAKMINDTLENSSMELSIELPSSLLSNSKSAKRKKSRLAL